VLGVVLFIVFGQDPSWVGRNNTAVDEQTIFDAQQASSNCPSTQPLLLRGTQTKRAQTAGHPHDAVRRLHRHLLVRLQPDEHQLRDSGYAVLGLPRLRATRRAAA
jgi:hypothetical protein